MIRRSGTIGINTPIGVNDQFEQPATMVLYDNYPNPFENETNISYYLPEPAQVQLKVFDLNGQEIQSLVEGFSPTGISTVSWDGRTPDGFKLPEGYYIFQLSTAKGQLSKKGIAKTAANCRIASP